MYIGTSWLVSNLCSCGQALRSRGPQQSEGAASRWYRIMSTHQALTRRPSRDIEAILADTGAVRADRAVDYHTVRDHTSKAGLDHHRE